MKVWRAASALVVIVLVAVLGVAVAPTRPAEAAIWYTYKITDNADADSDVDVALDSDGVPHAVYARGGSVYYRKGLGAEEPVADGSHPAIAVGPDGVPQVVFVDEGNKSCVMTRYGDVWGNSVVLDNNAGWTVIGGYPDIDVDGSNKWHVVYPAKQPSDNLPTILYRNADMGASDVIGDSYERAVWSEPNIKVDDAGKYHVICLYRYQDLGPPLQFDQLKYYTNSGSWGGESSTGDYGYDTIGSARNGMTFNSSENINVGFTVSGSIHYATLVPATGAWSVSSTSYAATELAVDADDSGTTGVAYNNGDKIYYCADTGSGLGSPASIGSGAAPALQLGSKFIYYVKSDGDDEIYLKTDQNLGPSLNFQPDNLIKFHNSGSYGGDDIYNLDGTDQTLCAIVDNNVAAIYDIMVQNDGDTSDTFTVTGNAGGGGWVVRYFDALSGGNNITSEVTDAGWSTGALSPDAYTEIRVVVKPGGTVAPGTSKDVLVTSTSAGDGTEQDAVKATTTVSKYQPDNQIRNKGQTNYAGNNVYNTTGSNQTRTQTVKNNVDATYEIRIENDGNNNDEFKVTGTPGGGGWTVKYFEVLGGGTTNNITTEVTGTGWSASPAVGTFVEIRVVVKPGSTVPPGSVKDLLVTSTSIGDGTKKDTVKATTKIPIAMLLGTNTAGTSNILRNNFVLTRFKATKSSTVTQIRVYPLVSGNVKVAIYADNGGKPGALLKAKNTATAVGAGKWNKIRFPATPVTINTYYWLAVATNAAGAASYYGTVGPSRTKSITDFGTFAFPNQPGTGWTAQSWKTSIGGWGAVP